MLPEDAIKKLEGQPVVKVKRTRKTKQTPVNVSIGFKEPKGIPLMVKIVLAVSGLALFILFMIYFHGTTYMQGYEDGINYVRNH